MGVKGAAAFAGAAVFWAACLVGVKFASASLGVALTVALIGIVGALALFTQAVMVRRRMTWRLNWAAVLSWAALGGGIVWAATCAASWAGVAIAALTISSIPLFYTVVGQMRGQVSATVLRAVSLLLGIGGLAFVAAFPSGNVDWSFAGGLLAGLLAAIAIGSCGRQFMMRLHHANAVESAIASSAIGGFASLILIPLSPPVAVSVGGIFIVIAIAVAGAFAMLFAMSHAADSVPRRTLAILPGVGTVLAVIAGVALVGEQLSIPQVLGLLLILAGTGLLLGLVPRWFPASWRA